MAEPGSDVLLRAKRALAQLLLTDVETAHVSLDLADNTRSDERRRASRDIAVRAYSMIAEHLKYDKLTPEDTTRVSNGLRGFVIILFLSEKFAQRRSKR